MASELAAYPQDMTAPILGLRLKQRYFKSSWEKQNFKKYFDKHSQKKVLELHDSFFDNGCPP